VTVLAVDILAGVEGVTATVLLAGARPSGSRM
jgi:hypothetical protein